MRHLPLTFLALLLLLAAPVIAADCPTLVQQALAATESACQTTGKNQACYGNIRLQAQPNAQASDFTFDNPGDRVPLRDIKSLQLSPMAVETGEWGVALMRIQANLPAASADNVMLLAFGDVAIENTAPQPTEAEVQVSVDEAINVRWLPNISAGAVAVLQPGQRVTAVERLPDNSWLRINLPDSGETGWVKGDLVQGISDLNTLNVAAGDQPNYRPMQAFTFASGSGDTKCAEIPNDGLIIQTPEGAGEIRLWINQVVVKMGSTIYFQAQPGGDMVISALEGHATVEALGVTYTAVAGTRVRVPLDASLQPVAPPTLPEAYTLDDVQNLPVEPLQRDIVIQSPLSDDEVAVVQQQQLEQENVLTNVADAVTGTVQTAADGVETVVNTTVNTAGDVVSGTVNTATDIVSGTVGTVGDTVSGVVTVVTGGDGSTTGSGGTGGDSGDDSDGGLIGGIIDTVLDLPCVLLSCKPKP